MFEILRSILFVLPAVPTVRRPATSSRFPLVLEGGSCLQYSCTVLRRSISSISTSKYSTERKYELYTVQLVLYYVTTSTCSYSTTVALRTGAQSVIVPISHTLHTESTLRIYHWFSHRHTCMSMCLYLHTGFYTSPQQQYALSPQPVKNIQIIFWVTNDQP